jgi:pre-mRNA-processing factor 40
MADILQKHGFTEYATAEGRVYYHNANTNESVWELPQSVQDELASLSKPQPQAAAQVKNNQSHTDITKYLAPEPPSRLRDNEDEFLALLKENEVDATWSFNTVIESLIKDKRYWSISDPLAKQKVFESYLQNRSRDELMKENNSLEKFQDAFVKILESYGVTYYSRWVTIKQKISNESIYKHSVISEKIKRQTFESYVNKLKAQRDAAQLELKEKASLELDEYLRSLNFINLNTNWDEVLQFIKTDKRFEQNKHFQALNQLDLLKSYEVIIKSLQVNQLEKIKQLRRKIYRFDRIKRDAFRAKLNELREQHRIRANTKWIDIYPLIKSDDAFIGLLDTNGSNPFDLFQHVVKEEDSLIVAQKAVVEQFLIHKGIELDTDDQDNAEHQLSKIKTILQDNKETSHYDDITLKLIYDKLIAEIKESKRIEELHQRQELLNNKERFKSLLRRFNDPPITKNSTWVEYSPRLQTFKEFQNLPQETCHELFQDYLDLVVQREKELELQRELELKKIIEEANSTAPGTSSTRKRPIQQVVEPQEELDY